MRSRSEAMNNAFHIWKACLRKQQFPTREAAFQKGMEVYRCKHCSKWHRTSGVTKFVNQLRRTKKFRG